MSDDGIGLGWKQTLDVVLKNLDGVLSYVNNETFKIGEDWKNLQVHDQQHSTESIEEWLNLFGRVSSQYGRLDVLLTVQTSDTNLNTHLKGMYDDVDHGMVVFITSPCYEFSVHKASKRSVTEPVQYPLRTVDDNRCSTLRETTSALEQMLLQMQMETHNSVQGLLTILETRQQSGLMPFHKGDGYTSDASNSWKILFDANKNPRSCRWLRHATIAMASSIAIKNRPSASNSPNKDALRSADQIE